MSQRCSEIQPNSIGYFTGYKKFRMFHLLSIMATGLERVNVTIQYEMMWSGFNMTSILVYRESHWCTRWKI